MPDSVSVTVKVQPVAGTPGIRSRVAAAHGSCLRFGVDAVADNALADSAVCAVLTKRLRVPASVCAVPFGWITRDRTLSFAGDAALPGVRLENP